MTHPRPSQQTVRRWLLIAIVALAGGLRIYRIGAESLWLDEAFSVWLARQPAGEMLGWIVRIDQHPPLYYGLLRIWMRLGDDPATLRALSALCGTLTIPVLYRLGRRLAGPPVGLLAALLLALSPFHVRFSQEVRMYALLSLNGALAFYGLACLLTDPRLAQAGPGRQVIEFLHGWRASGIRPPLRTVDTDLAWGIYVLATTAMLWTHNTALFFPIAVNLIALAAFLSRRRRHPRAAARGARHWLLGQLGVGLLWAPWLPFLVSQAAGVYRQFWIPPPTAEDVIGVLGSFVIGQVAPTPLLVVSFGSLYVALVALGCRYFRRHPGRIPFLLAGIAVPFAGELLVSLRRPIFSDRTLIWASLPLILLLAGGVHRVRHRAAGVIVTLILVGVTGLGLADYTTRFEKEAWDDAAALVADQVEPDDLILFNATWVQLPFDYYFHRLYSGPAAEHGVPADLFDRGVLEPQMTAGDLPRLRELVRDRRRVWLVYSHHAYTDPEGLIPPALAEDHEPARQWTLYGVEIHLYAR